MVFLIRQTPNMSNNKLRCETQFFSLISPDICIEIELLSINRVRNNLEIIISEQKPSRFRSTR